MRVKQMNEQKTAQKAAIDFHLNRTVEDIEAKKVPVPQRGKKIEEQIYRLEPSVVLKMYLESLNFLVATLKLLQQWQPVEVCALLGSLG